MVMKRSKQGILGAEDALYNRNGEFLSSWRSPLDPDSDAWSAIVWYKEMLAGRGPVVTRHSENWISRTSTKRARRAGAPTPLLWPGVVRSTTGTGAGSSRRQQRPTAAMAPEAEVFPGIIGELSPIKVDHGMKTTIPGLFALGNACYNGSGIPGAVPAAPGRMRGSGLTGAVWMGVRAGESALVHAAAVSNPVVDPNQVEALKSQLYAPIRRTVGEDPTEVLRSIQAAFCPIGYSVYKRADRMEQAVGLLEKAKKRIPRLVAKDWHYLSTCNELKSMALSAELFYRASLERKESRGWFVREDFPEADDQNWLKWIMIRDKGGEPEISLEAVPIEKYAVRP